jgi:hypothetical protein
MAASSRRKGLGYEREVATLAQLSGFAVRGLESGGDHLLLSKDGRALASECKRAERLKIPEWIRQAEGDAPQGVPWVLAFRWNRVPSYGIQPLAYIFEREARIAELES